GGRRLPLELRRQSFARPAGEGIGLEVADVGDRGGRIDGQEPGERHLPPLARLAFPVAGRLPASGLDRGPAVREPVRRRPVAAVGHELEPLALVTSRLASRKSRSSTSWEGRSLSKWNDLPSCPMRLMPPGYAIHRGALIPSPCGREAGGAAR